MECGELGEWRNVILWEMLPSILGNVVKHSRECRQIFREISSNITGNVLKHSWDCPQTFQRMSPNIPGNVAKHSGECRQTFWGVSLNISGNVAKQILIHKFQNLIRIYENRDVYFFHLN